MTNNTEKLGAGAEFFAKTKTCTQFLQVRRCVKIKRKTDNYVFVQIIGGLGPPEEFKLDADEWADALTADAAEYFEEQEKGFFDQKIAQKLIDSVLSIGNTVDPEKAFANFRGRNLDSSALLRKMNLEKS